MELRTRTIPSSSLPWVCFWNRYIFVRDDPKPFCFTLDRADELHGKHTVFGRCIGDTLYSKHLQYHLYNRELLTERVLKMWWELGRWVRQSRLAIYQVLYLTDPGYRDWRWRSTSLVRHPFLLSFFSFQSNSNVTKTALPKSNQSESSKIPLTISFLE